MRWRPQYLFAARAGKGFVVSDLYIAAKVPSLEPWGVTEGRWVKRGRSSYDRCPGDQKPRSGLADLRKLAADSEAEAWPSDLYVNRDGPPTKLWLWTNEDGALILIDARLFHFLTTLTGDHEFRATCNGSASPLFLWGRNTHREQTWLGAIMPVRWLSGIPGELCLVEGSTK